jgi:hypothetical protein
MKVRIIIILIASIGFCKAQNRVITFEEAVKIALNNGVQLNQQRNNLENSQMQKTSAWLGF